MKRQAPIRGEVVPLSKLRGGQTKKRSQEAIRLSQKAVRHEMLADIADGDGETHTAILERGDAAPEHLHGARAPKLHCGRSVTATDGAGDAG